MTMTSQSDLQNQRGHIEQQSTSSTLSLNQDMDDFSVDDDDDVETARLINRNTRKVGSEGSIQSGLPESMPPLPGMVIRCHRLEKKDGKLTHCTTKEALAGAKAGKAHYWIDIDAHCHYNNGPTHGSSSSNNNKNRHYNSQYYQYDDSQNLNMNNGTGTYGSNDYSETSKELRSWLKQLESLPNFVIDLLADHPDTWASQVIPLPKAILAVIRILPPSSIDQLVANKGSLNGNNYNNEDNHDDHEMAHLAALCLRNMLITFTSSSYPTSSAASANLSRSLYASLLQRMKQSERLPAPTSHGALLAWLKYHLDRTSQATRQVRHLINSMDESMDRDIESVSLDEIIQVKDQLLRLLSVAEEQGECLESLIAATPLTTATTEKATASKATTAIRRSSNNNKNNDNGFQLLQGWLSVLLATAGSTERMALRLEKHILDLRQRCENNETHKMNRRLAVLTVLSAVFLPLTLFTGIWGMNFSNMPELNEPYAYPIALSFMLFIACLMISYFRRTGWFN